MNYTTIFRTCECGGKCNVRVGIAKTGEASKIVYGCEKCKSIMVADYDYPKTIKINQTK